MPALWCHFYKIHLLRSKTPGAILNALRSSICGSYPAGDRTESPHIDIALGVITQSSPHGRHMGERTISTCRGLSSMEFVHAWLCHLCEFKIQIAKKCDFYFLIFFVFQTSVMMRRRYTDTYWGSDNQILQTENRKKLIKTLLYEERVRTGSQQWNGLTIWSWFAGLDQLMAQDTWLVIRVGPASENKECITCIVVGK